MKFIIVLACSLVSFVSFGLSPEEIIEKMNSNYMKADRLEYNTVYSLLKGHKSTQVVESYQGYVYRENKDLYQRIHNTEFIYGQDFFSKINHDEKRMELGVPRVNQNMEVSDVVNLESCSKVELFDKGSYYSIKMYYVFGAQSPFSAVMLRVNKKDFKLLQIDLFYASFQNFSKEALQQDNAQAHLKIEFSKMTTKPKSKSDLFELAHYVSKTKNILNPTGKYSGYKLIENQLN